MLERRTGVGGRSRGARWALPGFGLALALLFAVVAIAEGVGGPGIPPGAVAVVEGAPAGTGTITGADFAHSLELAAAGRGLKAIPKPGDPAYRELKEAALGSLFETIWIPREAAEAGITVTSAELAAEVEKAKTEGFKSKAEYEKFLRTSHFTPADVSARVKAQMLGKRLEETLRRSAPAPGKAEIEGFYEGAKSSRFTQPASLDIRVIMNEDPTKVEAAETQLKKDHSAASWQKLASKYSEDPATKLRGGLQREVTFGAVESALNDAIFVAPVGQVEGPVKSHTIERFYVFEVERVTPKTVTPLARVRSQIVSELKQQAEQESVAAFGEAHLGAWQSRTVCAPGYVIARCGNYRGDGHPESAPKACYEAHPKGGLPKACPAPVQQLAPTLPGTVNIAAPKGKPLAQRPRPAGH